MVGKHGITFVIIILSARLLTPYEFGIYNYCLAVVIFLTIFGDFGISTATSKFVAEYSSTDEKKNEKLIFNSLCIIILITLLVILTALFFGRYYFNEKFIYIIYTLPLILLIPINSLYDGVYRGLKKFKHLAIISTCVGLFTLCSIYYLVLYFGVKGAILSQIIYNFLMFIALFLSYKKII